VTIVPELSNLNNIIIFGKNNLNKELSAYSNALCLLFMFCATASCTSTLLIPMPRTILALSSRTGFARDSGHERTFSKLPKVIQVPWKLPKQKDFYILINGSFNQNRLSLRSNFGAVWGTNAAGCRRADGGAVITSNLGTRNLSCYFFLRSDHILTIQTTKTQNMVGTKIQTPKV